MKVRYTFNEGGPFFTFTLYSPFQIRIYLGTRKDWSKRVWLFPRRKTA